MRLLVLRENGEGLIAALAARGHEGVPLPLEESRLLHEPAPEGPFEGFAITSAKAAGPLAAAFPLDPRPLLAVGSISAEAARTAGFTHVFEGAGEAAGMAALLADAGLGADAWLLYAAGRVRTGTLEAALAEAGRRVAVWEVYETLPAEPDPLRLAAISDGGPCEGAILLSRAQAQSLARLLEEAPGIAAPGFRAFCLSPRIAASLPESLAKDAAISAEPALHRLLERLDDPSFGS